MAANKKLGIMEKKWVENWPERWARFNVLCVVGSKSALLIKWNGQIANKCSNIPSICFNSNQKSDFLFGDSERFSQCRWQRNTFYCLKVNKKSTPIFILQYSRTETNKPETDNLDWCPMCLAAEFHMSQIYQIDKTSSSLPLLIEHS